jgi:DNA-directed RNA polymerase subunit RPC12/RpoP
LRGHVATANVSACPRRAAMHGKRDDETIELECPECGSRVRTTAREAEKRGLVRCPRGHEFAVLGMLGSSDGEAS